MCIFKKFTDDTSGSVFILTAVAAGVMVSLAGISTDLGMTIIERDRAQNAIDAGVVSGAIRASLGEPEAEVKDAAENYYQMNLPESKLLSDKSSWDIDPKTGKVSRKLEGDFNTFFGAGNRSALSVSVEASAVPSLMKASVPPELLNPPPPPKPVIGDIILVLDNSGSMDGSQLSDLQEASSEFLKEAFSAKNTVDGIYRVGILGFDDKVIVEHDISDDYTSLEKTVSKLKTGSGTSPIGLEEASDVFDKQSADDGRRKVVVLMTDGEFNSGGGQEGAISACNQLKKKKNVTIQTIFFKGDAETGDLTAMQQCPTQNGSFSFVTTKDELSSAFKKSLKDSDTPYVAPPPPPPPPPVVSQILLVQ